MRHASHSPQLLGFALALLSLGLLACSAGDGDGTAPVKEVPKAAQKSTTEPDQAASAEKTGPAATAPSGKIESVYTEIAVPDCQATLEEDPPIQLLECTGPANYSLQAHDEDARVSISILDPAGKVRPLDFWTTVTGAFSSLGPRAEWRLKDGAPTALIVRVNAYEHPEDPDKTTSYLVVAKIRSPETCVVAKVLPSATQNEQARQIADSSAGLGCLS